MRTIAEFTPYTAGNLVADRTLDDGYVSRVLGRWAVTASFVASAITPVAAPEIAVIHRRS